jgi:Fur family ferric uptake transcriptional regulator
MGVQTGSDWAGHARAVLRAAGHQKGAARDQLIELLARQDCALTALEIDDALRHGEPGGRRVGRASVYRVLELLQENSLVNRLEVGDGIARYEIVDPTGDHHHHLLCDECGQLIPFHDRDLERSIERLSRRLGFRTDGHEVVLHGSCVHCH